MSQDHTTEWHADDFKTQADATQEALREMLAALKDMVRTCRPTAIIEEEGKQALIRARAIIAAAEGR